MTKYDEFIEAYRKAYPHVRKKLQYDQAIELWKTLKSNPDEFEERYKKKMSELKLLQIENHGHTLKSFSQPKLNFGKVNVVAAKPVLQNPPEIAVASTSNENMASHSGRFSEKNTKNFFH